MPLVRGKADPRFPECKLVPLAKRPDHPEFPVVYAPLVPPDTFYRFDPATKKVRTLVTVMPDGTHVAWWTCKACSANLRRCECRRGMTTSRSIEYIYDKIIADQNGEDWSIHHPNYIGSFTKALKAKQEAARPQKEARLVIPSPIQRKAVTDEPRKPLTRRKAGNVVHVDFNMQDADKSAAASADDLTKKLTRKLTRKPEPKKGLTRRKK